VTSPPAVLGALVTRLRLKGYETALDSPVQRCTRAGAAARVGSDHPSPLPQRVGALARGNGRRRQSAAEAGTSSRSSTARASASTTLPPRPLRSSGRQLRAQASRSGS